MSITAIINLYKRPHVLIEQLTVIQNQSIPPENVIIWQNCVDGVEIPEIPNELKHNVSIIKSSKNYGVWARFVPGLLVNTKYICVFDDDTIPGCDWFKNCIETMKTHRGLLGTIGLRFLKGNSYHNSEARIGWESCNEKVELVDIVGHAWFFEQQWLHYLWECYPDYNTQFQCGEDIGFSYILQKYGINTYVPPHPANNKNLHGSNLEKAWAYGGDINATSRIDIVNKQFDIALKYYINLGFKTINNRKLEGNSHDHLTQIFEKINNEEHFGLIRPSDGEYMILENMTFTNIDNWTNNENGILRLQLMEVVKTCKPNLYIGLPCNSCCNGEMYKNYIEKYFVHKDQITYANICCNSNWQRTVKFLRSYEKGFYLVTCGSKECDFPIKGRYIIDKFLVNNWDNLHEVETQKFLEYVKTKQNELICFAAGPISKVWISKCMDVNSNNIYLDIGSVLDYYTKENNVNRPYTDSSTHYSCAVCNFV